MQLEHYHVVLHGRHSRFFAPTPADAFELFTDRTRTGHLKLRLRGHQIVDDRGQVHGLLLETHALTSAGGLYESHHSQRQTTKRQGQPKRRSRGDEPRFTRSARAAPVTAVR
jgi:hypothetical protein